MAEISRDPAKQAPREDFRKIITELSRKRGGHLEVFQDFCRIVACTLALQTREEEYLIVAKRYDRDELNRFSMALGGLVTEMEEHPFTDILGVYYTEINSTATAKARGEYYTPPGISKVMAQMLFCSGGEGTGSGVEQAIERGMPITVQDPACGSGGMILSLAELFAPRKAVDLLRMTLIDISPTACDMAYINTTLWGIPAKILQGNALTMKFEKGWKNIHWARVGEDDRLAVKRMIDLSREIFSGNQKETKKGKEREERSTPEKPNISIPEPEDRLDGEGQFQLGLDF